MRPTALFACFTLVEIFVFYWVQSMIGIGWSIVLVLLTAAVGTILVVRAGVSGISWTRRSLRREEASGTELGDSAAGLVSGLLLVWPGFLGDVLGLVLLLPPVRRPIYSWMTRRFGGRLTIITSGGVQGRPGPQSQLPGEEIIDVESWE